MENGSVKTELRKASGTISNIQTRQCGQSEKRRGALTIHNIDSPVKVEKSVFMDSDTYSVMILNSKQVDFDNNVIINSVKSGVWVEGSDKVSLTNNIVLNTNKRLLKTVKITEVNSNQCICCATAAKLCTGLVFKNNIGSGSDEMGLMIKYNECGGDKGDGK